ncbi:MAG: class I SAM-dependent methyltransferase [Bacteroidia bacterium]
MIQTAERSSARSASENPIYQRHIIAYQEAATRIGGYVLEVGCGEGYGISILAPVCDQYLGIDKFPTQIDLPKHARILQLEVPPFTGLADDSFDYVVSFQVIEHIQDDLRFLQEIRRVLKPGGKLILTTPNRLMSLSRNPWHIREYVPGEMKGILTEVFDAKKVELLGVFGNEKVMAYYEKNKASIRRFTRFDVFNLQYKLPRRLLQIPYDMANRLNRVLLKKENEGLVNDIVASDYYLAPVNEQALDYFAIVTK